jgi:hypothetical protein
MDWTILLLVAVGAFFLWQHLKNKKAAQVASERLDRDTRLLQHIKSAKREYDSKNRDQPNQFHKHGDLVYETAHYSVFYVSHFAESRLGFYFKNIEEYGLCGFFAGEPGEYYDSYYRTDNTFQKEIRLMSRAD